MENIITICFVVLHYNTIKETRNCISSIMALEHAECSRIVVVDNASPNRTGKMLEEEYRHYENIDVLLREHNDGFSAGNNAGCAYAINKWNPDFLVVANNDVEFCQRDFIGRVWEEYKRNPFAVLGPDIYAPVRGVHQSPLGRHFPSREKVMLLVLIDQLVLWLYPIIYPNVIKFFKNADLNLQSKTYGQYQENVCLMGACMIYSRDYMDARSKIFEPETKFYYEEYIQTLWCVRNNKKIVYKPDIVVHHMEGKATRTINKSEREWIKFRLQNTLQARIVYCKFFLNNNMP